jgi:hypothetical protein
VRATSDWVTGISVTFVSLLASSADISRFDGTSRRVALVGGTLGVRSYRVGNVRATSLGVASISVTLVAQLTTGRGISRVDGTSLRVALVSGTLSVRGNRISNVETSFDRIARVCEALISEVATARGILGNNTTSSWVTNVVGTLGVGSDRVGNVAASLDRIATVSVALISLVAHGRDISRADLSSGRVALVGGALGIGGDSIKSVFAASHRVASVGVAQVSLVARSRGISYYAVVLAVIRGIYNTLNGVASSLSGAISISLAGNFAGAKIGVDLVTSGRVASVASASGVGLDRVEDLGTSSLAAVSGRVAIVGVALIGTSARRRSRRRELDTLAARSSDGGLKADVGGIATIRSNAVTLAVTETAARSITSSSRNGLTSLLDKSSNERAQLAPVTSTEDLVLLSLCHDEKLRIGIDGTDTNSVNEDARNSLFSIVNGGLEIGIKIRNAKGLSLIFITRNSILILVDFTINLSCTITSRCLGGADEERRNDFVVVTISQHNQNLGGAHTDAFSGNGSSMLSFQHVGTVDHTARDTSTTTAASTGTDGRTRRDNTLGIRITLEGISTRKNVGLGVAILNINRTIPSVNVEVSDTQVNLSRTVGEAVD